MGLRAEIVYMYFWDRAVPYLLVCEVRAREIIAENRSRRGSASLSPQGMKSVSAGRNNSLASLIVHLGVIDGRL